MEIKSGFDECRTLLIALFAEAFAASEGVDEGEAIGELVNDHFTSTSPSDLYTFSTWTDGVVVGGILFSRLSFDGDKRSVFILSPVAVSPRHQRQGVGQRLITHGLNALRADGVDIAMTYGDPAYYSQTGFAPISATDAPPPLPLSRPEGWLAQSLTDAPVGQLRGPSHCVAALNNAAFW